MVWIHTIWYVPIGTYARRTYVRIAIPGTMVQVVFEYICTRVRTGTRVPVVRTYVRTNTCTIMELPYHWYGTSTIYGTMVEYTCTYHGTYCVRTIGTMVRTNGTIEYEYHGTIGTVVPLVPWY